MRDAAGVGGGETRAHLHRQLNRLAGSQGAPVEPRAQGLALQHFEDDVGDPILGADVVDGQDVGMIEGGHRPGLLLEAAEAVGARRAIGGDDLDRHLSPQSRVAGTVDLSHAPRPEGGNDLVRAETAAQ